MWTPVAGEFVLVLGDRTIIGQVVDMPYEHADHDHGHVPWFWVQRHDQTGRHHQPRSPAPYYLPEIARIPVRSR